MLETSKIVERILRDNPDARNSDKILRYEVWEYQGFRLNDTQKRFYFEKLIDPETIRRTRQKLQERGLYPSDKAVKKRREELAREVSNEMSADKILDETPRAISWLRDEG